MPSIKLTLSFETIRIDHWAHSTRLHIFQHLRLVVFPRFYDRSTLYGPFILPNRSSVVYFHRSTRYFIESINLLQPLLIPVLPVFRNHQTSPSTGFVISIFSPWQLTEIETVRASNLVILSLFPPCMNIHTYSFVNLSIERFLPGTILAPAPRTSAIYACSKYRLRVNNDDRLDLSFEIVRNLLTISRYRGVSNYFEHDSIFKTLVSLGSRVSTSLQILDLRQSYSTDT